MLIIKIIVLIFALIPHPLVMVIAHIFQPLFYRAIKKKRWGLKVKKIIPRVFKDKNSDWHNRIIKQNSLHLMKFAGEMLKGPFTPDWRVNKKCYIGEGKKFFDELYESCTGFIIITCHLGNWEWGAAYLALNYKTLYAPVFVEDSKGNRVLNWIRSGHNVVLLEASRDPRVSAGTLLRMVNLVRKGEIIYLVADQAAVGGDFKGVFFGAELRMFGGPFILGEKTKKPFLPLYTLRDEKNRIALHFEKPFFLNGEDRDRDIETVINFFERNISAHPEQYLWSQDRWKK